MPIPPVAKSMSFSIRMSNGDKKKDSISKQATGTMHAVHASINEEELE